MTRKENHRTSAYILHSTPLRTNNALAELGCSSLGALVYCFLQQCRRYRTLEKGSYSKDISWSRNWPTHSRECDHVLAGPCRVIYLDISSKRNIPTSKKSSTIRRLHGKYVDLLNGDRDMDEAFHEYKLH